MDFLPGWPLSANTLFFFGFLLFCGALGGYVAHRWRWLPSITGFMVVGFVAGPNVLGVISATGLAQSRIVVDVALALILYRLGLSIDTKRLAHERRVVLVSLTESALSFCAVYFGLGLVGVSGLTAAVIATIAVSSSPAVLIHVAHELRASGPVTERAIVLSTLGTLYALTWGSAKAGLLNRPESALSDAFYPVIVVLGLSIVVGAVLALALRTALRVMSPTSENTSMMVLALIAAGTTLAAHFGGSAPLAALLGGMLLKQLNPRPWTWPRQLGTAASILTTLMFVLVSVVAAQADWSKPVAGLVLAVIGVRALAKITGVALANPGSGASWRQALWVGCAMAPMSSVALLLVSQFVVSSPANGPLIARIALPAILLMEVLGAIIATVAVYRSGESIKPWLGSPSQPEPRERAGESSNGT